MADEPEGPNNDWWKKAIEASSPSMFRGGAGLAIFIGATRWVPDLPGVLENYVDYGLIAGAGISGLMIVRGIFTSK